MRTSLAGGVVRSLGLVYGDIGTSPIYTLTVVFLIVQPTLQNVMGILSIIVWTLILVITVKYTWLAMSLSQKGEGGTIVLREIVRPLIKNAKTLGFVTFVTITGISLLIGDGVITPAISILSAVEGIALVPGIGSVPHELLVGIAVAIALGLFLIQRRGSDKVSAAFGPVMVVWFAVLAVSGLFSILQAPEIVAALSPTYAVDFFAHQGFAAFFVMAETFLCATGGEDLYADMGHLGRKPITVGWGFVIIALVLSYFGQGSFILRHPDASNLLFSLVRDQAPFLYIPFLLLSLVATVIASQAIISGVFSIVYQGITTQLMPLLKIDYTSHDRRSQIYIGAINWFLMIAVISVIIGFGESSKLAAAYGFAVSGSMTLTSILLMITFTKLKKWPQAIVSYLLFWVDIAYFIANVLKIPHGAFWSIILAAVPFLLIMVFTSGQRRLYSNMRPTPLPDFLEKYLAAYIQSRNIPGAAIYFTRGIERIPPYISSTMLDDGIIYEDNIIVSIVRLDAPFGVEGTLAHELAPGLQHLEIRAGYMEVVDVEKVLRQEGIAERTIFYGVEDISSSSPVWRLFSFIKKVSPSFVQFYKMPREKVHGIVTHVRM